MLSDKVPYYILDLLQQVPSLYVRGLGRFDAIFHPAVLDLPQAQIRPPFLEPGFREGLTSDDVLLPEFMKYAAGCTLQEAEAAIATFVDNLKSSTADGKTCAIDKFGAFSHSESGGLRFTPDWDAFNLSFRGLEIIDLKPMPVQAPEREPSPFIEPTPQSVSTGGSLSVEKTGLTAAPAPAMPDAVRSSTSMPLPSPEETSSRMWWLILLSAMLLIGVACIYLAWDIISSRARLNEIRTTLPDTAVTSPDPVVTPDTAVTGATHDTIAGDIPGDTTKGSTGTSPDDGTPCYIIVGAFSNVSNIRRMTDRLSSLGYTPAELPGGSLTRVAIQTGCDPANLQRVLDEARISVHPEAWLY